MERFLSSTRKDQELIANFEPEIATEGRLRPPYTDGRCSAETRNVKRWLME